MFLGSQAQGLASKETTAATEEDGTAVAVGGPPDGQSSAGKKKEEASGGVGGMCFPVGTGESHPIGNCKKKAGQGDIGGAIARHPSHDEQPTLLVQRQWQSRVPEQQQHSVETGGEAHPSSTAQQEQHQQQQDPVVLKENPPSLPFGAILTGRKRSGGRRKALKQQHQQDPSNKHPQQANGYQQHPKQSQQQQPQQHQTGTRVLRGYRLSLQGLEGPSQRFAPGGTGQASHQFNSNDGLGKVAGDSSLGTPHCVVPGWCHRSSQTPSLDESLLSEDACWSAGPPVHETPPFLPSVASGALPHTTFGPPTPLAYKQYPSPGAANQAFACYGASGCDASKIVPHRQAIAPFPPIVQGLMPAWFCPQHQSTEIMQQQQNGRHPQCVCQFPTPYPTPPSGTYVHPLARSVALAAPGSVGWGSVVIPSSICLLNDTARRTPHSCITPRAHPWQPGLGPPPHGEGAERIFSWMQQVPLLGRPAHRNHRIPIWQQRKLFAARLLRSSY